MDINCLKDFLYAKFNSSDSEECLYIHGKSSSALLYSTLFLPELIILDDSVLLRKNLKEEVDVRRFQKAKIEKKMTLQVLEASFNFIEVGYLFNTNGRDTTDNEDFILAKKIQEAWQAFLNFKFPNRNFMVEILSPEETGSTVGVQFYEVRNTSYSPCKNSHN